MRLTPEQRADMLAHCREMEQSGLDFPIIEEYLYALDLADELTAAHRKIAEQALIIDCMNDPDAGDHDQMTNAELEVREYWCNDEAARTELVQRDWPTGEGMAEIDARENPR